MAELLVRAGIGQITLIDRDFIEISNLQRQSLFNEKDVGKLKAPTAKKRLTQINEKVEILTQVKDINSQNIVSIGKTDIILACTDNMESRLLLNDYCLKERIPLVYGACISDKGSYFYNSPKKDLFTVYF